MKYGLLRAVPLRLFSKCAQSRLSVIAGDSKCWLKSLMTGLLVVSQHQCGIQLYVLHDAALASSKPQSLNH